MRHPDSSHPRAEHTGVGVRLQVARANIPASAGGFCPRRVAPERLCLYIYGMGPGATLCWRAHARSDVGKVRKINEDSLLDRSERGLWAVADGMGGHAAGDRASQLVVEYLDRVPEHPDLAGMVDAVDDALGSANDALRQLAQDERKRTIGCTVSAMVARGRHCAMLWAGDSRAYRHRNGEAFARLTQDHAMVEQLVAQGLLDREEAEKHPQANLITRAVGADGNLHVDIELFEMAPGDVYLLCSDGLYKEVRDEEMGAMLADGGVDDPAHALVELALERGSRDNVSVVTVHVFERDGAA